ncbi:hypothetical protein ACIQMJ_25770 [Actinosynnema sp. NPDC091369]
MMQSSRETRYLEFVGVMVTVVPFFVAAFNVLTLARYDVTVLPSIIRGSDAVTVAFGAFVVVAIFLPWALVAFLSDPFVNWMTVRWWVHFGISFMVILIASLVFPVVVAVGALLQWIYMLMLGKLLSLRAKVRDGEGVGRGSGAEFLRRLPLGKIRSSVKFFGVASLMVTLVILSFFGDSRWIPLEKVVTSDRAYVGWVLESGDHHLSLLLEDSREPLMLQQENVVRRTVCTKDEDFGLRRTLLRPIPSIVADGWHVPVSVPGCPNV